MFEQLVEKLPVGICVVDENYRLVYLNAFFIDRMQTTWRKNYEGELLETVFPEQAKFLKRRIKSVFVLQHPSFSYWEQRPHIFPFRSSRPITGEETQMYQNMEIVPIKDKPNGQRLACIFLQDVTAQASYFKTQQKLSEALKREHKAQQQLIRKLDSAQSQLIQAEKMASTGQLAAGIAHEINNPIGFVQANLNTLQQYSMHLVQLCDAVESRLQDERDELKEFLSALQEEHHYELLREDMADLIAESEDGLKRVHDIVQNLKQFALEEKTGLQTLDISEATHQLIQLVSAQYKTPTYRVQCQPDLIRLQCDPGAVKQALMKVVMNAAQSVSDSGWVNVLLSEQDDTVIIKVMDNGCGISQENMKKVFTPFFTTKPEGQGQGLGLSVAYTAIEQHNGNIHINSSPGRGTVVVITLPLRQDEISLQEFASESPGESFG